ncbi:T9SS type A sorting domain-containing protein [Sporocytophaga myxococcoides]|uniref:T9SS type A sorting domain-containing protein n=1 Tax=Sporocytophaga myxococcoides TaxID=153721 RepID=UPI00040BE454|nr:T9SS type A sorting domain-containing protein [Sporocytophaga myxococcoides]
MKKRKLISKSYGSFNAARKKKRMNAMTLLFMLLFILALSKASAQTINYYVRVHVIPLSDDNGGRGNTVTIAQLQTHIADANSAFAAAGIRLEFDPATDWTPLNSTTLNSMANGGSNWWVAPNNEAAKYPGKAVIFLRHGGTNATPASNAFAYPPNTGYTPALSFAPLPTSNVNFVAFYNRLDYAQGNRATFVHELGHYFGLYHTFPGWSDNLTDTPAKATAFINNNGGNANALDGDRLSDTNPDAGTAYYTNNVGGCNATNTYTINNISFTANKSNVMSYFGGCQPPWQFSTQQRTLIVKTLQHNYRNNLINKPAVRVTAVFSPSTAEEIQLIGVSYTEYRKKYDDIWNQGWRLFKLDQHVDQGKVYYSAIWRKNTSSEIQVYEYNYADFRAKYDQLWGQGWRLQLLSNVVVNGVVKYTAIWRPSTSAEVQVYEWNYADYKAKYDQLWGQGYRLHILNNVVVNGVVKYIAVWRPSTSGEVQVYEWNYTDYRTKYDQLWGQGWRLFLLNQTIVNGAVKYTAVWRPSSAGEVQIYEWNYQDYRKKYAELTATGWRLKLLEVLPASNNARVASDDYATIEQYTSHTTNNLILYPNPSSGIFNVKILNESPAVKIEVFDSKGSLKYSEEKNASEAGSETPLNLSHLEKGIYFLRVAGDGDPHTEKLIIE